MFRGVGMAGADVSGLELLELLLGSEFVGLEGEKGELEGWISGEGKRVGEAREGTIFEEGGCGGCG